MREKALQERPECGKLAVKDGWLICPVCRKGKVLKVRDDTVVRNLEVRCKLCGQKTLVNIESLSQSRCASA